MGFFDRLSRLLRASLNDLVSKAEDPVKVLDQAMIDMQAELVKLRQAVATALASQRRLKSQADQAEGQAGHWLERAEQALRAGEEDLARQALTRRRASLETHQALAPQLEAATGQAEALKQSLLKLEGKLSEAKTRKNMLKARAQAAQAQVQLQNSVEGLSTDSAMAAFERMEEKVEALEAVSAVNVELAGTNLESRFTALEGTESVNAELSALKRQINPAAHDKAPGLPQAKADATDLEALRRSIEQP